MIPTLGNEMTIESPVEEGMGGVLFFNNPPYRRHGKTIGFGLGLLSLLDRSPDSEKNAEVGSIFSSGRRASEKMLKIIQKLIIEMQRKEAFRKFVISVLGSDPYNKLITLTDEKQ